MPVPRVPMAEKFWPKVQKTDGCWLWMANRLPHKRDYGLIHEGGRGSRSLRAHRVSYELSYGPIPDGLFVLHKCDNPPCVRPDHLFLGTQLENMRDMVEKGRQARFHGLKGERNPASKLVPADVYVIRRSTGPTRPVAEMFGITTQLVRHIRRRLAWKHLPEEECLLAAFAGALGD